MTGLTEALTALVLGAEAALWQALPVFLRVGGVMALLPGFGDLVVPARVRLVLALSFTLVVAPAAPPLAGPVTPGVLIAEAAAGLVLGAGFRLMVMALQMAGAMAAQAMTLTQLFPGAGVDPQPAVGNLFFFAGIALAMTMGLHVEVARLILLSYEVMPIGRAPMAGDVALWGLGRIGEAFALAFALAAPFTLAGLVYNLALGLINRAMPMLMVTFVGAPALTLGGLALLAVAAPFGLGLWQGALADFAAAPFAP
jgi:flagellar biosynthetic protein FliR